MRHVSDGIPLSFDGTVSRDMVHRSAISEVFLTDLRTVDEKTVLAGAQIPGCHGYFNDFTYHYADADPLLLLEICRQAGIGGAHALNVPKDTILISDDFELDVHDVGAFRDQGHLAAVRIESRFDWLTTRRGQPRDMTCMQSMLVNGATAATFRGSGRFMSRTQLEALRQEQRGNPPPSTVGMKDRPEGIAVPPQAVGRYNPQNVVLAAPDIEEDMVRAIIVPPWQNRALFDHAYDHLTMQVLTEAARQLAMITLSHGLDTRGQRWQIKVVKGRFVQFAEIDLPVTVTTKFPVPRKGEITLSVSLIQGGHEVASIELHFFARGGQPS